MNKISVAIIEDDEFYRDFLFRLIENENDFEPLHVATTLSEALTQFSRRPAHLSLVDLHLPDGEGHEYIRHVKKKRKGTKALVLTTLGDRKNVFKALSAGADGLLLKDTPGDQICRNLRAVMDGHTPISPQAASYVIDYFKQSTNDNHPNMDEGVAPLTGREGEVLSLFARGLSYAEVGTTLNISRNTVSSHVKMIYEKLDVHSKSEAIFEASQLGWL